MYALHPSSLPSGSGREWRMVTADDLIQRYGVNPDECVIWDPVATGRYWPDYIHLFPRVDGIYDLKAATDASRKQGARQ